MVAAKLPSVGGRAAGSALQERVAEPRSDLQDAGITVSDEEARRMLEELDAGNDTAERLRRLHDELQRLVSLLEQLEDLPFGR